MRVTIIETQCVRKTIKIILGCLLVLICTIPTTAQDGKQTGTEETHPCNIGQTKESSPNSIDLYVHLQQEPETGTEYTVELTLE